MSRKVEEVLRSLLKPRSPRPDEDHAYWAGHEAMRQAVIRSLNTATGGTFETGF